VVSEVVLILVVVALLLAIWMPAIVGVSEQKQRQNERSWMRD
jgi:hypothetical protein